MRDWRGEIERRLRGAELSSGSEADVIEELEQHLDDRYRELRQNGVDESEAARIALQELHGQEPLRLALRNVKQRTDTTVVLGEERRRGIPGVWQDVRYALRMFRKNAGFTAAAVLALGLGAGAATAVFSLLEGVVLRPLPYVQPDRLVMLFETNEQKSLDHEPFSPVTMMEYRRLQGAFLDVAGWWRPEVNLVDYAGDPIRVTTVEASENFFPVLGVNVALGRTFPQDATLHGQEPEVVISDRLWRTRFGADRSVVGRPIRMNGQALIVVGVMPPGFHFPDDTDAWQRLSWDLEQHNRAARFMGVVGRLRPGVLVEQVNAEMNGLARRLETEYPRSNQGWKARAVPLRADVAGVFGPGLLALFGAAGLLLLIACINVANLLLARSSARQTEVAVRSALGASRLRLLRQFLLESLVLSAGGALVGLLVAVTAVRSFLRWTPIEIPRADEVNVNFAVLGFTALTTVVTAIIFGLAPALLASRVNLQVALKESTRGATGRAGRMARSVLVVAEVALAVALLAGAGLLIRTISALMHENTGVQPGTAISVDLQLPYNGYQDWPAVERFYSTLLPALRARSPISSVGGSNFMPLETGWRMPYRLPGAAPARANEQTLAQYHTVDEGYFQTLGVRLMRGRFFDARDAAGAPGVVVVNESFARLLWPGENAVGKQLLTTGGNVGPLGGRLSENDLHEVVGVVADVKNTSIMLAAEPAIYATSRQFPFRRMFIVANGAASAEALATTIRDEIHKLDPSLPLGEVRTMQRVIAASADPPRFVMLVMSVFAGLALILAAVGIYGILSYNVSQRSRELGVRLALGARPVDVLRLVMTEGMALAGTGALLGIAVALIGARFLKGILYGVTPSDPLTLTLVVMVVLSVGVVACASPGRRAARADPVNSLRS